MKRLQLVLSENIFLKQSHGAGPKPRIFTSKSRRPCGHQKPKYQNKTIDQFMSNYLHTDIDFDINLWHDGGMRVLFNHSLIPPTALECYRTRAVSFSGFVINRWNPFPTMIGRYRQTTNPSPKTPPSFQADTAF